MCCCCCLLEKELYITAAGVISQWTGQGTAQSRTRTQVSMGNIANKYSRGARGTSPSMLDSRGIKSLENKVKPRVVTHAHHMAAKCNTTHQSGWTVCTGSHFILPYCYDTRGLSALRHIVFTYTILGDFLISLLKEGNLPSLHYSVLF